MKPVFILSLPRSGSTMLQRRLSAHSDVATVGEPFLALALLTPLRDGVYSEYGHRTIRRAFRSFVSELPDGEGSYLRACGDLATRLYKEQSGGEVKYFLDKSPRYSLVAEELLEMFPEGRFIVLWRNPLAVMASTYSTWGKGMAALGFLEVDVKKGYKGLAAVARSGDPRVTTVRYEDFAAKPEETLDHLSSFLGVDFDPDAELAASEIAGYRGEPSADRTAAVFDKRSLEKWRGVLAPPVRRRFAKNLISAIDDADLETAGYPKQELLAELRGLPSSFRGVVSDSARLCAWKLAKRFHGFTYLNQRRRAREGEELFTVY